MATIKECQQIKKKALEKILTEYSLMLEDCPNLFKNYGEKRAIDLITAWQQRQNRKYGSFMFELGTEIFQLQREQAGLGRFETLLHNDIMKQVLASANRVGYAGLRKGLLEKWSDEFLLDNYENNVLSWERNAGRMYAKADKKCVGYYLDLSPTACDFCKQMADLNAKYEDTGGINVSPSKLENIFHDNCRCNWIVKF